MWLKSRKKIFKKQSFFKKLRRKITFSMQKTIKSLMFVVEKTYPVNNHMFKIDIENTRTRCEICSKLIIKTPQFFFYCWLWTCICLLGSYLHFHCLNNFAHGCTFWNWHRGESHIGFCTQYVIMMIAGGGLSLMTFWNYCWGIIICFTYNYFIVDGKRSFIN